MNIWDKEEKFEASEAFSGHHSKRDRALEGIRIIEYCSRVSGPYCAKIMADLGAEVLKIEPPVVGDETRYRGPFAQDDPHLDLVLKRSSSKGDQGRKWDENESYL